MKRFYLVFDDSIELNASFNSNRKFIASVYIEKFKSISDFCEHIKKEYLIKNNDIIITINGFQFLPNEVSLIFCLLIVLIFMYFFVLLVN